MRLPLVTPEGQARIEEVCRQRAAIPSDKELARELGVSHWTVTKRMHEFRNGHRSGVSRDTRTHDEVADAIIREYGLK